MNGAQCRVAQCTEQFGAIDPIIDFGHHTGIAFAGLARGAQYLEELEQGGIGADILTVGGRAGGEQ